MSWYLVNIFQCSDAGCIHISDCYIFLMNLPQLCIMTSFVSCYQFWLKVYFVWYKYDYLHFLLKYFVCSISFLAFASIIGMLNWYCPKAPICTAFFFLQFSLLFSVYVILNNFSLLNFNFTDSFLNSVEFTDEVVDKTPPFWCCIF